MTRITPWDDLTEKVMNKMGRNAVQGFGWQYIQSMLHTADPIFESNKRLKQREQDPFYQADQGKLGFVRWMHEQFQAAFKAVLEEERERRKNEQNND